MLYDISRSIIYIYIYTVRMCTEAFIEQIFLAPIVYNVEDL